MDKKLKFPPFDPDQALQDILRRLSVKPGDDFEKFLNIQNGGPVANELPAVLYQPLRDLTHRPGKRIRGRLVEIGYRLAFPQRIALGAQSKTVQKISEAVEYLHASSLAVDDLQDGSKIRRGQPTLHLKYGMPVALNTGNFLYFWPLQIIHSINLPPEIELKAYRYYHQTLARAHAGQALDVGVQVSSLPQEKVPGVCLTAMELKSGALFALALVLGAIAGGADERTIRCLEKFGHAFGMTLQMFDDLGNLKGIKEPMKKWEDLLLRRPTFIWACASLYPKKTYDLFVSAVRQLPNDRRLQRWLEHNSFFSTARGHAKFHLDKSIGSLGADFRGKPCAGPLVAGLKKLGDEISEAYE